MKHGGRRDHRGRAGREAPRPGRRRAGRPSGPGPGAGSAGGPSAARACAEIGPSRPSRPWRLSTRRNRTDRRQGPALERLGQDPVLLLRRARAARPGAWRTRGGRRGRRRRIASSSSSTASACPSLLGGVEQGLGVRPGRLRAVVVEDRAGRRRSRPSFGVAHAAAPPCAVGRRGRGQLVDGDLDQPAVVVVAECPCQDPAGDRDRQVGRLRPDLERAWSRAVAMSRSARSREASASAWALRMISSAAACGVAPAPPRSSPGPDPAASAMQAAVLGQHVLGSRSGPARCRAGRAPGAPPAGGGPPGAASRRTCRARAAGRGRRRPSRCASERLGLEDVGLASALVAGSMARSSASPTRRDWRRGCVGCAARRRGRDGPTPATPADDGREPQGQDRLPEHGVSSPSSRVRVVAIRDVPVPRATGRPAPAATARAGPGAERRGPIRRSGPIEPESSDDDQREERHALDQRGRDDHGRLDVRRRSRAGGPCSRRPTWPARRCPSRPP